MPRDKVMMTPREIVSELDKYIVGQDEAKRAVAVALRNRWRRAQVEEPLRSEITPKNILMIGPTGVGKTEIARRLARLTEAPFVKTEATKFTEVGYVGRNVESIIKDLTEVGVKLAREGQKRAVRARAREIAVERVLDILVPPPREMSQERSGTDQAGEGVARRRYRELLLAGELDDRVVEAEVSGVRAGLNVLVPDGMEGMEEQLRELFEQGQAQKRERRRIPVGRLLETYTDEEAGRLINQEDLIKEALASVENDGIVFIDEIDKIARGNGENVGGDVSREGVQRDLLPLIEGTSVRTKYGWVRTDHILFIASGAFHLSKPSDLVPELQGRLPIRVELKSLTADDFERILTSTDCSLVKQYKALLAADHAAIEFTPEALRHIARYAYEVNERTENIGARRLHTVMEKLLSEVSYEAGNAASLSVTIDADYVRAKLGDLVGDDDLSRYVL